jgi:cell wall-associated NlpC family hydrolase
VPRVPTCRAALSAAALTLCVSLAAFPAAAETARAKSLVESTRSTVETVWHGAQDLAIYALGMIGVDYRYGGDTPEEGLDCSGLVRHVFQEVTGVTLPRTSKELARVGKAVQRADLKPGDLVFFNTRRFAFSHVGIYLGDDRFIHAPRTGSEVEIAQLDNGYWRKHFDGARRLVGVLPGMIPSAEASTIADAPK